MTTASLLLGVAVTLLSLTTVQAAPKVDLMGMAKFMERYENESKIIYYDNIVQAWNYNVDTSKKNLKLMVCTVYIVHV